MTASVILQNVSDDKRHVSVGVLGSRVALPGETIEVEAWAAVAYECQRSTWKRVATKDSEGRVRLVREKSPGGSVAALSKSPGRVSETTEAVATTGKRRRHSRPVKSPGQRGAAE